MKTKNRSNKIIVGLALVAMVAVVALLGRGLQQSMLTGTAIPVDDDTQFNNLIDLDNPVNQIEYDAAANTSRLWNADKPWQDCVYSPVFTGGSYNSNTRKIGVACAAGMCAWYNPENPDEIAQINLNDPKIWSFVEGYNSLTRDARAAGRREDEIVVNSGYNICPSAVQNAANDAGIGADLSCLEWDANSLAIKARFMNDGQLVVKTGKQERNLSNPAELDNFVNSTFKIMSNPFVVPWVKQHGTAVCDTIQTYENGNNENTSFFYSNPNSDGSYTFSWDGTEDFGNMIGGDVHYSIDLAKDRYGSDLISPVPFLHAGVIMGTDPVWHDHSRWGAIAEGLNIRDYVIPASNRQSVTITAEGMGGLLANPNIVEYFNTPTYWRVCYAVNGDWAGQSNCGQWVPVRSLDVEESAPTPDPINGRCGSANGTTVSSEPTGGSACAAGEVAGMSESSTDWRWTCMGEHGGSQSSTCIANKPTATTPETPAPTNTTFRWTKPTATNPTRYSMDLAKSASGSSKRGRFRDPITSTSVTVPTNELSGYSHWRICYISNEYPNWNEEKCSPYTSLSNTNLGVLPSPAAPTPEPPAEPTERLACTESGGTINVPGGKHGEYTESCVFDMTTVLNNGYLKFYAKGDSDVHIAFGKDGLTGLGENQVYEIVFDGWTRRSAIRDGAGTEPKVWGGEAGTRYGKEYFVAMYQGDIYAGTMDALNNSELVTRAMNHNGDFTNDSPLLMKYDDPSPMNGFRYIGLSSWDNDVIVRNYEWIPL